MSEMNDYIRERLSAMPGAPGVYQFVDVDGKVIYVGKAKNLKNRVSSYFHSNLSSGKVRTLVSKINDLVYFQVNTEQDALLLENSLIKQHQPKYNILLKDDKTYPSIVIKKENFPRVFKTRNIIHDGSTYFGPYSSASVVNNMLDLAKSLYKVRTCNLDLSIDNILNKRFKPCLEFQIGNCCAPCIGLQSIEEYNDSISNIKHIFKGNINEVKAVLNTKMMDFVKNLEFEKAQICKNKLQLIDQFQSKSAVVNSSVGFLDVYAIAEDKESAYVSYLQVSSGSIILTYTIELKRKLNESIEELLIYAIEEMRSRFSSNAKELVLPFTVDLSWFDLVYTIPQKGDKRKLLDLAEKNANYYKYERIKQKSRLNIQQRSFRVLDTLKKDLQLSELPVHIECFDNSNLQGTNPVAACVVFKHGKASKKDYRKFNIKTVEGPDDFASMREIIYRRYSRLIEEESDIPQLIIIDGGKGQLSSAVEVLSQLPFPVMPNVIGLAKKLEEVFFPGDPVPLYLDKRGESLKLIQQLRDEAHRFGITFHRSKRSKAQVTSELDGIKGVGPKVIEKLLVAFGSVKRIKMATEAEIAVAVGPSKSKIVYNYLNNNKI